MKMVNFLRLFPLGSTVPHMILSIDFYVACCNSNSKKINLQWHYSEIKTEEGNNCHHDPTPIFGF